MKNEETRETVRFIRTFDRFFDMLNTRSIEESIYKRKPDLAPYREPDDKRLKVMQLVIDYSHGYQAIFFSGLKVTS